MEGLILCNYWGLFESVARCVIFETHVLKMVRGFVTIFRFSSRKTMFILLDWMEFSAQTMIGYFGPISGTSQLDLGPTFQPQASPACLLDLEHALEGVFLYSITE